MLPGASLLRIEGGGITIVTGQIKNDHGDLLGNAIPKVTIVKHARFLQEECVDLEQEVEITGRIERRRSAVSRLGGRRSDALWHSQRDR